MASFYDPIRLLCAFLITLKVGLRKLCINEAYEDTPDGEKCNLDWDDQLPAGLEKKWNFLIKLLVMAKMIVFSRGTKPKNAIGRLDPIGLWDASMDAYSALIN